MRRGGIPERRRNHKDVVWLGHEDIVFRDVIHVFGDPLQEGVRPVQHRVALQTDRLSEQFFIVLQSSYLRT